MGNTTAQLSTIAEQSAWSQAKTSAIRKLHRTIREARDKVASLGYQAAPGHVRETLRDAEIDAKLSLSEINAKITEQAMARNKAIAQVEYEDTYNTARMAWELRKQGLLDSLEQWLADLAKEDDLKDEEVEREALAIDARRLVLLQEKTALEYERLAIEGDLASYDRLPLPKERELAAARLETVRQRESIIPYLEQLLDIEADIIEAKTSDLYPKQSELVGVLGQIVARKLADIFPLERQYHQDRRAELQDRVALEAVRGELATDRGELIAKKKNDVLPLRDSLVGSLETLESERQSAESSRLAAEADAAAAIAAEASLIQNERTALESARRAVVTAEMNTLHPLEVTAETSRGQAADARLSAMPSLADAASQRLDTVTHEYQVLEPQRKLIADELLAVAQARLAAIPDAEDAVAQAEQANAERRRDVLLPSVMDAAVAALAQLVGREGTVLPEQQTLANQQYALAADRLATLLPAQTALVSRLADLSAARSGLLVPARAALANAEKALADAKAAKVPQRIDAAQIDLQRAQARYDGIAQESTFTSRRLAIEELRRQLALAEMARARSGEQGDQAFASYQLGVEQSAAATRALIEVGAVPAVGGSDQQGTFTPPAGDSILELTARLREIEDQWRDQFRRANAVNGTEERRYPLYVRQNAFATGSITGTSSRTPPGQKSEHYGGNGLDEIEGSILEARHDVVSYFRSYQQMWTDMLALLKVEAL